MLEAGRTQAVGKALGLDNLIGQLETMAEGKSMADVSISYDIGEASEIWTEIFQPLKEAKLCQHKSFIPVRAIGNAHPHNNDSC